MFRQLGLVIALAITGCSSLPINSKNNEVATEKARSIYHYSTPVPSGYVRFEYYNTSSTSKCILADDFQRHPDRPLLRVTDVETGETANYIGPMSDRPSFSMEPGFIIVRPGQAIEATFDLENRYDVIEGRSYRVMYSLPVTECSALIKTQFLIPDASAPFSRSSLKPLPEWTDKLQFVRDHYDDWAKVGDFVEFEVTLTF